MHDKHLKIIWICYEYIHRIFMGFHFIMLCGQIFVHAPKEKHFLNILPPSSSTSPANSAIRRPTGSEVRAPRALPTDRSTLLAPLRLLLHHSAPSERDQIFSSHLRGSFWPVWPILSEGRLPRRIQKKFFPCFRVDGPEVGSEAFVGMSLHPSPPWEHSGQPLRRLCASV